MTETRADPPAEPLQFEKADYTHAAPSKICASCANPVAFEYFELSGRLLCTGCAQVLKRAGTGGAAFVRALAFGGVAALAGAGVWFAIIKLANMEIGLIAVGVGLLVGTAVRKGARGLGGWRYQAMAMLLTYAAIATSYAPFILSGLAASDSLSPSTAVLALIVMVTALAAPFASGNIMGLIIIAIALYEAWKLNRRVSITGPFALSRP